MEKQKIEKSKTILLRDLILEESKKGNIVVSTIEGLMTMPIRYIVNQPIEGLLYDLNRDTATILTFIEDPKWVNDFACSQVIRELKNRLSQYEDSINKK